MSLLTQASLVITPSAYKEGKLYSVIPSDGSGDLSVTRATTATRVNSAGLVELVPYNLLQYSETFASPWGVLSGASVSANSAVSPNGQNTAATFSVTSTAFSGFIQTLGSSAQNISIYAKKGTLDYLWIVNENISAIGASYNLATGVVTYTASGHTATIESVGNGWYRCTISHPTNGWEYMQFGLSNASNSSSSPSGGNAYIWGAQAVEGSSALPYQKTETRLNIPRLDYSNGTCPSILVEPQRTNLLQYSSSFSNWLDAGGTVTSNTTIAPDGTTTADTLTGLRYQTGFGTNVFTFSCYAKANGGSGNFWIRVDVPATNQTVFDLNNGTYSAPSGYTASIEDVGNGWYRCSMTTPNITIINAVVASADYGANSTYIWGAQLEAGSYATSYIPTTSASVTRNADVISKTGISSLIGQTEGTLYFDFEFNGNNESIICDISAVGFSPQNRIILYQPNNYYVQFVVQYNDVAQVNIVSPNYALGQRLKVGVAYKNNDFAFYINGVLIGTDNSGSVPATSRIDIGNRQDLAFPSTISVNAAALWKTRLTNAELATLTTI